MCPVCARDRVCARYVPTLVYAGDMWQMTEYAATVVYVGMRESLLTIKELTTDFETLGVYGGRVYVMHRRRHVIGSFTYQYEPLRYFDYRHEPIH